MENKTIAIHQPETLPYPGFFSKMANSDEFIIMDNVQFKKNNYQNRNQIINAGKSKWITFPVVKEGRLDSTIKDTKLADTVDWRARNIKILEDAYKNCFYYEDHIPHLRKIIYESDDSLFSLNMNFIHYIRECLQIDTPMIYLSSLNISSHKSDLVFDICKERGAEIYYSGKGGRDYLQLNKFEESGIDVYYQEFRGNLTYVQETESFIPYMSTIDLLMNNSNEEAIEYIEDAFYYTK